MRVYHTPRFELGDNEKMETPEAVEIVIKTTGKSRKVAGVHAGFAEWSCRVAADLTMG